MLNNIPEPPPDAPPLVWVCAAVIALSVAVVIAAPSVEKFLDYLKAKRAAAMPLDPKEVAAIIVARLRADGLRCDPKEVAAAVAAHLRNDYPMSPDGLKKHVGDIKDALIDSDGVVPSLRDVSKAVGRIEGTASDHAKELAALRLDLAKGK